VASRGRLLGVVAVPIKGALLIPFDDIAEILSWGPSLAELARRLDSRPDKLMALRSNSLRSGKTLLRRFSAEPGTPFPRACGVEGRFRLSAPQHLGYESLAAHFSGGSHPRTCFVCEPSPRSLSSKKKRGGARAAPSVLPG